MQFNPGLQASAHICYSVEHREGCTLFFGAMPIRDFSALTKAGPQKAVLSDTLARLTHASFAFGPVKSVDALIAQLTPAAMKLVQGACPDLEDAAIAWLVCGAQGQSSAAMFHHLTAVKHHLLGLDERNLSAHPRDPSDLGRCRLLLESVPSFSVRINELRSLSPFWSALVEHWDILCATMDDECPRWREHLGEAPKTFDILQRLAADHAA